MTIEFKFEDVFTWVHKSEDNRKIKIIIPVFNEASRIDYLIENMIGDFKIVFLDGGSTDETINIIKSYDCDILLRNDPYINGYGIQKNKLAQKIFDGQNGTSWCIAYYINHVSNAYFTLRLWADEYINKEERSKVISHFKKGGGNLTGVRMDWFYGQRLAPVAYYPLSFRKGEAVWDDKVLHSDLLRQSDEVSLQEIVVEHFSLCDTGLNISRWTKYTVAELERITVGRKYKYPPVFYRYGLMFFSPIKNIRKYKSVKLFLIALLLQAMDCIMGHVLFIERFYLLSAKEQNDKYKGYADNN